MSYPISTVLRARELAEGGWKAVEIRDLLEREGRGRPSHTTVGMWMDPEKYRVHRDRSRAQQLRQAADNAQFRMGGSSPDYRRALMVRLRSEGLSCHAIGVVHGVVFGDRLTAHQVRYALRDLPSTVGV